MNPNTLAALRVSRSFHSAKQFGRLTLAQSAENMDAIGNISSVCSHVYQLAGFTIPEWHAKTLSRVNLNLSLATAQRVAALWGKWVQHSDDIPSLTLVESFLFDLRRVLGDK
jgi:hypothetical protein